MVEHFFGEFGGRYVPEMLIPALEELETLYSQCVDDPGFKADLQKLYQQYAGRPTPLYHAENLTRELGGCQIYLKLEGLLHTGAHKINNALGQALLAKRLGKTRLIAETGAGQHGVATATVAAKFGLECKVFMGDVDIKRQYPNVYAMKLLGAEVIPVKDGTRTLKDAVNAALKYWIEHLEETHYLFGSALGPAPYPVIVRDFQSVIGTEVKAQSMKELGRIPDILVACVGGGSNAIGLFYPFLEDKGIEMIGVEAGGRSAQIGDHAARLQNDPQVGIVQGYKSYFLQDSQGQLQPTHSISAGLDYAGIGPEHAKLFSDKRVRYEAVSDQDVLAAFQTLARTEGILPALESSHAVAQAIKIAGTRGKDEVMVVNISGRGDKDLFITADALDRKAWHQFLKDELET